MVAREESESDAESGWSGVSDNSSTDSECTNVEASSVASDQDRFDTAFEAFRDLAKGLYNIGLTRCSRGVNPIAFPGINAPEGLFYSPCGPKNVARKVTAIHCVSKDISELVSLLISLPRDGESIPTLVSTPIYLNVRE